MRILYGDVTASKGKVKPKPAHKESSHYAFNYRGHRIDPYRIFKIYGIVDGPQQHAIKKLLRAGRSVKPLERDIDEVIESLQRWKEMIQEDKE